MNGHDIVFEVVDPRSAEATNAVQAYFDELDRRFPEGFDPGDALTSDADRLQPPHGAFVLARRGGSVVGCGGVQTIGPGVGEIKRMWVAPDARGQGLGPRLLAELESEARALGHGVVRLDTNSVLVEAVAMYERAGYHRIARYNDNPYPDRFFEKAL